MMKQNTQSGFTLIELSIVLVIIGLLAGSVLVGRDLLLMAQVRSEVSSITQLTTAIGAFRLKYGCYPGDCPNASSLFPAPVYNGNGDGNFDPGWTTGYDVLPPTQNFAPASESIEAMNHLALAGLINLSPFNRTDPNVIHNRQAWINIKGHQCGILPITMRGVNYLRIGFSAPYVSTFFYPSNDGYEMSPYEAWKIDEKLDDGLPRSGKIQNEVTLNVPPDYTWTTGCSSATAYSTSTENSNCTPLIRADF